ncbi:transcription factor MYB8-like [Punica granatum]|uniref:Uncharacterized protein n=2 Tax=Punica granatum TaxID=22663 RepID=A0A218XGR3_PUNGR|nr:transcription factor MYB8-like [Punica granatum]OWM84114.1 hypothetical protein CDL15_Pgr009361 [Punica granatum]PKI79020.1 hypothetical protein CRG98_000593 [Punica granatum]
MGRNPSPTLLKDGLNKGAWTVIEDYILIDYVKRNGEGKWGRVVKETGLRRCGKSCRLRWLNYLRPDIKRGNISDDEEELIIRLHKLLGNRWSLIAGRLPGRTDNKIKNYWNTVLKKKSKLGGEQPKNHKPINDITVKYQCNEVLEAIAHEDHPLDQTTAASAVLPKASTANTTILQAEGQVILPMAVENINDCCPWDFTAVEHKLGEVFMSEFVDLFTIAANDLYPQNNGRPGECENVFDVKRSVHSSSDDLVAGPN